MRRGYTLLTLGLVLLVGSVCRAGQIGVAQLPPDAVPAQMAAPPAAPLPAAAPAAVPFGEGGPCATCGHCASCGGGRGHCHCELPCLERLCDWLTYCPPKVACCHGCCGHKCEPCCMPPYMYFLDRCSCTLGYHGYTVHPPVPGPASEESTAPAGPAGDTYGAGATAGR
jgi:hypothetical protein